MNKLVDFGGPLYRIVDDGIVLGTLDRSVKLTFIKESEPGLAFTDLEELARSTVYADTGAQWSSVPDAALDQRVMWQSMPECRIDVPEHDTGKVLNACIYQNKGVSI